MVPVVGVVLHAAVYIPFSIVIVGVAIIVVQRVALLGGHICVPVVVYPWVALLVGHHVPPLGGRVHVPVVPLPVQLLYTGCVW